VGTSQNIARNAFAALPLTLRCTAGGVAASQRRTAASGRATGATDKWIGLIDDQAFFDKNETKKRPMSPCMFPGVGVIHGGTYRWQLTSALSIINRATGVGLALGMSGVAVILAGGGPGTADALLQWGAATVPGPLIFAGKFVMAWPFAYHFANGIRHLMWDTASGLDLDTVYKTGWTVLTISSIASVAMVVGL